MRIRRALIFTLLLIPAIVGVLVAVLPNTRNRTLAFTMSPFTMPPLVVGLILSVAGLLGYFAIQALFRRANQRATQIAFDTTLKLKVEHSAFLIRVKHQQKQSLEAILLNVGNIEYRLMKTEFGISTEDVMHDLGAIRQGVARLDHLADSLGKLARLSSGQIERAPTDLVSLLTEVIADVKLEQADRKEVKVEAMFPNIPKLPKVEGDRNLLYEAFHNLLSNAVKFSHQGGRVQIIASEAEGIMTLRVADEGVGFEAQEKEQIMGGFYRAKTALGIDGSGIGLIMAIEIIRLHRGEFDINSQGVNDGTVATVRLPIIN